MGFWERVKEEIIKQNTTQEWVANAVGMDHGAFRSALSKKQEPRISKAISVAKALGVTVEYLYNGSDDTVKYEDIQLHRLALKYRDLLELINFQDEETIETIRKVIKAIAKDESKGMMVADSGMKGNKE